MSDLDEFRRIEAEATMLTERQLGPRPTVRIIPVSLIGVVGAYFVLLAFSVLTGTFETSETTILVFVAAIGGATYWALRRREDKWIRARIENEMRIRQDVARLN
jgi:drug/metabolite transporter (DMT)-like permease